MHLPDPVYVTFLTAVITSVTAIATLVRTILEKKRSSSHVQKSGVSKKLFRLDKSKNWQQDARPIEALAGAKIDVMILTHPDNDHIHPSNLNRYLYYM